MQCVDFPLKLVKIIKKFLLCSENFKRDIVDQKIKRSITHVSMLDNSPEGTI